MICLPQSQKKKNGHNLFLSHNFLYVTPELYESSLISQNISIGMSSNHQTHTDTKNIFIEDRFLGLVQKCSKCSDVK